MAKRTDTSVEEVVAALSRDQLADVVVAAAERHPDVEHAVRLAAAHATGDLSVVEATVRSALQTRRFLGYRESNEWAHRARPVVAELTALAETGPSAELVELLQRAIGRVVKVVGRADDSAGQIGDLVWSLLEAHALACDAGVADPAKLARWMVRFDLGDEHDFEVDPVRYATALGDRGLAAFRRAVDAHDRQDDFAVRYARMRLAILDRDIDEIVRWFGGELHHAGMYLSVAEAMVEIDRPDLVLEWTARGIELGGWQIERLYDVACATQRRLNAPLEVLRLRRAHHQRAPSSGTYVKLREAAEGLDVWGVERGAARGLLRDQDIRGYVQALLGDGDDEEAWVTAQGTVEGELDDATWIALAERRAATDPADALPVYLAVADRALVETGRSHYARAVRLLKAARGVAVAAAQQEAFDVHLVALCEQHRRRPTLIAMLDKAGLA